MCVFPRAHHAYHGASRRRGASTVARENYSAPSTNLVDLVDLVDLEDSEGPVSKSSSSSSSSSEKQKAPWGEIVPPPYLLNGMRVKMEVVG